MDQSSDIRKRFSPSPSPGYTHSSPSAGQKRKRSISSNFPLELGAPLNKAQVTSSGLESLERDWYDLIGYWAATGTWPPETLQQRGFEMSQGLIPPVERPKQKMHRSVLLQRLAAEGIFTRSSSLIQPSSKEYCKTLSQGNRAAPEFISIPRDKFFEILDRVQNLNEARLQRDLMPWIVPPAEVLFSCGELKIDYLGDEVQADWTRCATMGGTRPRPDYTAGLLPKAFTKDETLKLNNYATPTSPVYVTPELCFPFLICEAKTGERGLNEAERQNVHSGAIAVNAIIRLYMAAFGSSAPNRVKSLSGQILAFTISHDNDQVRLYGNFAIATNDVEDKYEYYRHPVMGQWLSARDGMNMFEVYSFVRNIYDDFAPKHLQRVKDALAAMPAPGLQTTMSFANSETISQQVDSQYITPTVSESGEDTDELMMRQHRDKLLQQIEQQRIDTKRERDGLQHQMEQQQQQLEHQRQQMEHQQQQMEYLMEKQMEHHMKK